MRQAIPLEPASARMPSCWWRTPPESAAQLMRLNGYEDVLIPGAGGADQIGGGGTPPSRSSKPALATAFIFVDDSANFDMAASIIDNAKTSRPSVCNAVENVLVHRAIAPCLPAPGWPSPRPCRGGDPRVQRDLCHPFPAPSPPPKRISTPSTNDYILAVKVVSGIDEAISFIESHSTHHSEAIITESYAHSQQFLSRCGFWLRCMSTPPPGSPTAASSASARRLASPPKAPYPRAHGPFGTDHHKIHHHLWRRPDPLAKRENCYVEYYPMPQPRRRKTAVQPAGRPLPGAGRHRPGNGGDAVHQPDPASPGQFQEKAKFERMLLPRPQFDPVPLNPQRRPTPCHFAVFPLVSFIQRQAGQLRLQRQWPSDGAGF